MKVILKKFTQIYIFKKNQVLVNISKALSNACESTLHLVLYY